MIKVYRRHLKDCPHRSEGRAYRRCQCPCWGDGLPLIQPETLDTTDWDTAQYKARNLESQIGSPEPKSGEPITLAYAWDKFLKLREQDGNAKPTLDKFKLFRRAMEEFAEANHITLLEQFNPSVLTNFKLTWKTWSPRTARAHIERMHGFFKFCTAQEWIPKDPSISVKPARRIEDPKTMPLDEKQWLELLKACDTYRQSINGSAGALRVKALVQVMRYSGLAIADAVKLRKSDIDADGVFHIYRQKTGAPVNNLLPPHILKVLASVPPASGKYFFWSGQGDLQTAVKDFQARLADIFELAGIPKLGTHMVSHRLRDSYAVSLLLAGRSTEDVAAALGDTVPVVLKHYSPWIAARQEKLERDIRSSFHVDPAEVLFSEVHSSSHVPPIFAN